MLVSSGFTRCISATFSLNRSMDIISAASRCMNSSGLITRCVVPSRHGVLSFSSTCPAALSRAGVTSFPTFGNRVGRTWSPDCRNSNGRSRGRRPSRARLVVVASWGRPRRPGRPVTFCAFDYPAFACSTVSWEVEHGRRPRRCRLRAPRRWWLLPPWGAPFSVARRPWQPAPQLIPYARPGVVGCRPEGGKSIVQCFLSF